MKKLSLIAALATLALAAPALAQTPSDVRNFRTPSYSQGASEVRLDHTSRTMNQDTMTNSSANHTANTDENHTTHHGKMHHHKGKHHGKKHHLNGKKHHMKKHHGKMHHTDAAAPTDTSNTAK